MDAVVDASDAFAEARAMSGGRISREDELVDVDDEAQGDSVENHFADVLAYASDGPDRRFFRAVSRAFEVRRGRADAGSGL